MASEFSQSLGTILSTPLQWAASFVMLEWPLMSSKPCDKGSTVQSEAAGAQKTPA